MGNEREGTQVMDAEQMDEFIGRLTQEKTVELVREAVQYLGDDQVIDLVLEVCDQHTPAWVGELLDKIEKKYHGKDDDATA